MISLKLIHPKQFMSQLLLSDTFDRFSFMEGEIVTFNTFTIDGYLQKEFWEGEDPEQEYSYWKDVKDYCYSLIRGKKTPLSFKFVFSLSPAGIARLIRQKELGFRPEDVQGLYLNLRFNEQGLYCVTGTSFRSFTMDKSLEREWDDMVKRFFLQKKIESEPA